MKEAIEAIGSLLLLLILSLIQVLWAITKLAVFVSILWGVAKSLSSTSIPVIGKIVAWAKTASPDFFGSSILVWISDNWMPIAILAIFLISIVNRRSLNELRETSGYTRTFIGTLMNYFRVEAETTAMKTMHQEGVWAVVKQGFMEKVVNRLLGIELHDDRLNAKAVRDGIEVNLVDDIKNVANSDNEGTDVENEW